MSNEPQPETTFSAILASSIARETIARLPCPSCKQNTHIRIRRVLPPPPSEGGDAAPLPPVFVVNAGVRTADELETWMDGRQGAGSRFLRSGFRLSRGKAGEPVVRAAEDGSELQSGEVEYALRVRLFGSLSEFADETDAPHLHLRRLRLCRSRLRATLLISLLTLVVGLFAYSSSSLSDPLPTSQSRRRRIRRPGRGTYSTTSLFVPSARKRCSASPEHGRCGSSPVLLVVSPC